MFELVTSALQAILQVIVIVLFGVILTKTGHFDNSKQKWLSRLNLTFFTPCLLFFNIASTISLEKFVALWPIPVFFGVFILVSWIASQWILRVMNIHGAHRRFVLACAMFCNTNSLPIAIITSLAFSEGGHLLFWHKDDTQQDVAARGVAYAVFYATFCNIIRWSYGYHLLQPHSIHDNTKQQQQDLPSSTIETAVRYDTQQDVQVDSAPISSISELSPLLPVMNGIPTDSHHSFHLVIWQQMKATGAILHAYMSPPLYAVILGLLVGLSPLQPLLFNKHAFLYPSVTKAVQSCGTSAVPLSLVCLGAQLTFIAQAKTNQQPSTASSSSDYNDSSRRAVVASLVARMLITPLFVIGIVIICLEYITVGLLQDPVFVVILIILGCSPTAIDLSQVSQVSGVFEEEMLRVLFWSYGIVCVPVMTAIVFVALNIVEIWT